MKLDVNNLEKYSDPDDSLRVPKKEKKQIKRMKKWQS